MSLNITVIVGNLGKDPEIKSIAQGRNLAKFSIATSQNWTSSDGQRNSKTTWHNVVCFGPLADIAGRYLKKGNLVGVTGKYIHRSYQDNTGATRYISEIQADQLQMFGSRNKEEHIVSETMPSETMNRRSSTSFTDTNQQSESTELDEMPF